MQFLWTVLYNVYISPTIKIKYSKLSHMTEEEMEFGSKPFF